MRGLDFCEAKRLGECLIIERHSLRHGVRRATSLREGGKKKARGKRHGLKSSNFLAVQDGFHQRVAVIAQCQQEEGCIAPD